MKILTLIPAVFGLILSILVIACQEELDMEANPSTIVTKKDPPPAPAVKKSTPNPTATHVPYPKKDHTIQTGSFVSDRHCMNIHKITEQGHHPYQYRLVAHWRKDYIDKLIDMDIKQNIPKNVRWERDEFAIYDCLFKAELGTLGKSRVREATCTEDGKRKQSVPYYIYIETLRNDGTVIEVGINDGQSEPVDAVYNVWGKGMVKAKCPEQRN